MDEMRKLGMATALLAGLFLVGCGMSTHGPDGSMHQTQTGVSETGYPGRPTPSNDPESPSLSSSSETKYSRAEAPEPGGAKKESTPEAK